MTIATDDDLCGQLLSGRFEFTARQNLWNTVDVRSLSSLGDEESGKKITAAF